MSELDDRIDSLMVEVDQLLRTRLKEIGLRGAHVVFLAPEDRPSRIRSNVDAEDLKGMAADMAEIAEQAGTMTPRRPN